jgi:hypothetical protein
MGSLLLNRVTGAAKVTARDSVTFTVVSNSR